MKLLRMLLVISCALGAGGCANALGDRGGDEFIRIEEPTPARRINARSPWYPVAADDLALHVDDHAWNPDAGRLEPRLEVFEQAKRMIRDADDLIVFSFFLFDNLHAPVEPTVDIVGELTDLIIQKRRENPDLVVVFVLDLMHKAWMVRESPAIARLSEAGVDVFYSDRLETRAASRLGVWEAINEVGRFVDVGTGGIGGRIADIFGMTPAPLPGVEFDGEPIRVGTIASASLLKANHRKILLTRSGGRMHALVTSWNPHNPSSRHENHAITVSGGLADYIYDVVREDVRKSIALGHRYVDFADSTPQRGRAYLRERLPEIASDAPAPIDADTPLAAFATERAIETMTLEWLAAVEPGDEIRVQMFYLSHVPVLHALIDAGRRSGRPVQVLLDPNRQGINYVRDGTPNAQAADYLVRRARIEGVDVQVRWYNTDGEQNHAKAMTITNAQTGRQWITLGSANWSRKNLAGINLEANLFVRNAPHLVERFNGRFDVAWGGTGGAHEYSVTWDDPRFNYHHHTGSGRWATRSSLLVIPMSDPDGRPVLLEEELVHW